MCIKNWSYSAFFFFFLCWMFIPDLKLQLYVLGHKLCHLHNIQDKENYFICTVFWFHFFCQIIPVLLQKAKIFKHYLLIFIPHCSQQYFLHKRHLFIEYVSLKFQTRDPENSNTYHVWNWLCSLVFCRVFEVKIINFLQVTLELSSGLFSKIRKVDYSSQ